MINNKLEFLIVLSYNKLFYGVVINSRWMGKKVCRSIALCVRRYPVFGLKRCTLSVYKNNFICLIDSDLEIVTKSFRITGLTSNCELLNLF